MKQTVTIETEDYAVLQLLRNLASMDLLKFIKKAPSIEDQITARFNEIYKDEDSSLEPCFMMAQADAIGNVDW